MTGEGDDPPTIVESFVRGDEAALVEVYARWSPLVYSVALRSLGTVTDAEKVTQRVFTHAWSSRRSFDPSRVKLPAWLIEITRSKIAETGAIGGGPEPSRTQVAGPTPTSDEIALADLADRLVVADEVSRLPSTPRQVVRLALADDLTHAQIAERLGLPVNRVKRDLGVSLVRLRRRLAVLHGAY